jgi:hypothetical protein
LAVRENGRFARQEGRKLDKSEDGGQETSAAGTFDVGQVSGIAVGLDSVSAHATLADGSTCSADFLLRIEGGVRDSPVDVGSARPRSWRAEASSR